MIGERIDKISNWTVCVQHCCTRLIAAPYRTLTKGLHEQLNGRCFDDIYVQLFCTLRVDIK